jgi:uncharacterized protein (DUF983 family)
MEEEQAALKRPVWRSIWRGFRMRCPACGQGRIFSGFLKVADRCPACDEDLSHQRADDAPPYFTIVIVGHIVIPLMWAGEKFLAPPVGLQIAFWLPLIAGLTLWLLPRVKGAIVGLQWGARMHGFGGPAQPAPDHHSHWKQGNLPHP